MLINDIDYIIKYDILLSAVAVNIFKEVFNMNNKFFEIDLSIYDKEGKLLHETALTAPNIDLVNKLCNKEHNIKVISEQGYGSVNYVIIEVTKRALKTTLESLLISLNIRYR